MSAIVVTAANQAYTSLLDDLLASLEEHGAGLNLHAGVLDLGLAPDALERVAARGAKIVKPAWPFRPHAKFAADPVFMARAARPFLRDFFPSHATYIWLDADIWIQHPLGLRWLIDAARNADLAAVPTVHRAYAFRPHDFQWLHRRYAMAFGEALANDLMRRTYVNSGVMSARAGSPLWRTFAQRFQMALDRWDGDFLSDQAVLNATIMLDGLAMNRLPARANWLCHLAVPCWNPQTKLLTEPALPFDPLLVVHNTFDGKTAPRTLASLKGQPRNAQLTRSGIRLLAHSESQ